MTKVNINLNKMMQLSVVCPNFIRKTTKKTIILPKVQTRNENRLLMKFQQEFLREKSIKGKQPMIVKSLYYEFLKPLHDESL